MDQLKYVISAGAAIIIVASVAACSSLSPNASPPPTANHSSAPATTSPITKASVAPPKGETVLGQLNSQRGTNQVGPFPVTTHEIAVYFICYGAGKANVTVIGVGSFPMPCSPTAKAQGIRNTFDARYVKTVSVEAQGDNSLLWGLTVTSIPNP